ncbi:MAG: CoA-binding protein [Pirellulales bacterium]
MSKPTVAILGASSNPNKFGYKSLRAHLKRGYIVYPVNPKGGEIDGLQVYERLADIPVERLDRISIYLPPAVLLKLLPEVAAKGCEEIFLNPGTESDEVIAGARALGLEPIQACSIVELGLTPDRVE